MHILILDDDVLLLKSLRRLLKLALSPATVTCSSSADEATQLLTTETFDMVIADLMLPGTTGDAFLELTRRLAPTAIRVAASGRFDGENVSRVLRTAHRVIQKPYSSSVIASICSDVASFVAEDRARRELVLCAMDIAAFANQCDLHSSASVGSAAQRLTAEEAMAQNLQNPWRCVLALQAVALPMMEATPENASVSGAITALGSDVVRALGRTERSRDEEPLVNSVRLRWIGAQSCSAAALARRIAGDLVLLPGTFDMFGDVELAAAATMLSRIAEPVFPIDTGRDKVITASAQALSVRGLNRSIIDTMLSARRSDSQSTDSIAAIATHLALALTANPMFPLLTQEVRWRLRTSGLEERLVVWRQLAENTAITLSPAA